MKHKTAYPTAIAREATAEELKEFHDRVEWDLDTCGDLFGENYQEWLDIDKEPTLTVFDNFFRPGSAFDGRLLIATFPCKNRACYQVHFGWRRMPTEGVGEYVNLQWIGDEEFEREAAI